MAEVEQRTGALMREVKAETSAEVRTILSQLGLSSPASAVLLALVCSDGATAAGLIRTTGIADSKIYYILEELRERGLLEIVAGRPKTYRAVATALVGENLRRALAERQEADLSALTRLLSLLEPLRAATTTTSNPEIALIIKGSPNVLARARALVAGARTEVTLLASEVAFIDGLLEELRSAASRRVRLRLACPAIPLPNVIERAAERRAIGCFCSILVVDGTQVLTLSGEPGMVRYALLSTDETLVRLALDYWDSPRCCTEAAAAGAMVSGP